MRQELLERSERVGVEVRGVLRQRHGQNRIDGQTELEGSLRHQEIGTARHPRHDPHLRVREVNAQRLQEVRYGAAQVLKDIRVKIPVPGYPDDER
jgi:hypothetical protein